MTPSKVSIGGGNFPASHGDSRDDLGYGRLNPKYHVPKMLGNDVYPYRDQDEDLGDLETFLDEEEEEEMWDRMEAPSGYDPGGGHYDPFSYAGSNTSLHGPSAITEFVDSMVPIRQQKLYPRASSMAVGGTGPAGTMATGSKRSPSINYGDRWGWSNPVYQDFEEDSEEQDNYTLEDIANIEETLLRVWIRTILLETT